MDSLLPFARSQIKDLITCHHDLSRHVDVSYPSTSQAYAPLTRSKTMGLPPTDLNARTGELTPPGMIPCSKHDGSTMPRGGSSDLRQESSGNAGCSEEAESSYQSGRRSSQ